MNTSDNPFQAAAENPFQLDDSINDSNVEDANLTNVSNPFGNDSSSMMYSTSSLSAGVTGTMDNALDPSAGWTGNTDTMDAGFGNEYEPPALSISAPVKTDVPPWMASSGNTVNASEDSTLLKGKSTFPAPDPNPFNSTNKPDDSVIAQRMKDLEDRERALARREKELETRQAQLGDSIQMVKKPNYPTCFPLIRANIKEDILEQNRMMVRIGFIVWHLTELGYIYNWIAVVVLWQNDKNKSLTNFFMATVVAIVGIAFSYMFWWQALYRAGSLNTTFAYMSFMFHFFFHVFWSFWMFLAIPVVGSMSAGLIDFILNLLKGQLANALVSLINALIWGSVAALSIVVFRLAWQRWRGQGGEAELQRQASVVSTISKTLWGPQNPATPVAP